MGLWGLNGAERTLTTMHDNSSTRVLVEVAEYAHPQSRPRAMNYTMADHGFTHIVGQGTHDAGDFHGTYSIILNDGFTCNYLAAVPGLLHSVYCHDHDGFTYELEQFPA